jgi:predicted transcriptional regulator
MPVNTNEWQKEHPWEPSPTSHPHPVPLVKPSDLFNPMLSIAEIMKHEAPVCSPDTPVAEAVRVMRDKAAEAVFVVVEERPLGVLTDRAVALAVADRGDDVGRLRAQDLMKHHPPTVRMDDRLDVLLDTFTDEGVAVVDKNEHIRGVVRWIDLLGCLSERALGRLVANLFRPGHPRTDGQAR